MPPPRLLGSLLLAAAGAAAAAATGGAQPVAGGVAFARNFKPEGAWGDHGEEASPFFLNGKLYMMQSIMGRFPADGSQGTHSGFCVYDARSGEKVACPDSSSAFAFCSAIVDHTVPPQRLWVFCSAWDRGNHSYCNNSAWGCGACADAAHGKGSGCYVGSWSTEDLASWDGPHKALTLPMNQTVPNVGASMVASPSKVPGLPTHQAFMALEGGSTNTDIAINTGTDRDLSKNWVLLKHGGQHGANSHGLACPSARYNPTDQYYYVFGGGNDIRITRTKDFSAWEQRNMSMMTHCIAQDICLKYRPACKPGVQSAEECCIKAPDCSPASGEGQIAPGYFTNYWENKSDCQNLGRPNQSCRRDMLGNISQWDWSVNDADFCDEGGKGPTRFLYCMCQQTKPRAAQNVTFRGGGGYHIGTFPGNERQWLSSFYPPREAHLRGARAAGSGTVKGGEPRIVQSWGELASAVALLPTSPSKAASFVLGSGFTMAGYNGTNGTVITIPKGCVVSITSGGHTVLDAGGKGSLFIVEGSLTAEGLTLKNGVARGTGGNNGGAFRTDGSATFTRCSFINNSAPDGDGGVAHVYANASATFTSCSFAQNSARAGGGAVDVYLGTARFVDCSFEVDSRGTALKYNGIYDGGKISFGCPAGTTGADVPLKGNGTNRCCDKKTTQLPPAQQIASCH